MRCKLCNKQIEKGKEKYYESVRLCEECFKSNKTNNKKFINTPRVSWVIVNKINNK